MKSLSNRRNRFIKWLIVVAGCVFVLYLMRYILFASLAETLIAHQSNEKFEYANKNWEDGVLVYDQVSLGNQLHVAQLRLTPEFQLFPFRFSLEIYLAQPSFQLSSEAPTDVNLAFFVPTQWTSFKIDIEQGSLLIDQEPVGSIDFVSGPDVSHLGTLVLSSDEGNPYCTCEITYQNPQILYQLHLTEASALHLQAFLAFLNVETPFDLQGGMLNADLKGTFSSINGLECQGSIAGQNLLVLTSQGEWDFRQLDLNGSTRSRAPLLLNGHVAGGRFSNSSILIEETEADLTIHPDKKPFIHLQGTLSCGEMQGPFTCEAQGEVNRLEGKFQWWHAEIPFHLTHDVSGISLQADLHEFPLEFLKSFLPFNGGLLTTHLTARVENHLPAFVELQDLHLSSVKLLNHELFCHSAQGDMTLRLDSNKAVIEKALLSGEGVSYTRDTWSLSEGVLSLQIENNHFKPSLLTGKLNQISVQASWQGALEKIEGDITAIAPLSAWLLSKTPLSYDPETLLQAHFDTNQATVSWKGSLQLASDLIEAQGTIDLKSEQWKGEFQAPAIVLAHYGSFFPEAPLLEGKIALHGIFDPKQLQVAITSSDILVQTPQLICQIESPPSPLQVTWSFPEQKLWARIDDCPSTLHLKELEGPIEVKKSSVSLVADFKRSHVEWQADVQELSHRLTDNISLEKGHFHCGFDDGTFSVTEAAAHVVLPTRSLDIEIPKLHAEKDLWSFSAQIPQEALVMTGEVEYQDKLRINIQEATLGVNQLKEPLIYSQKNNEWSVQGGLSLATETLSHYLSLVQEAGFYKELTLPTLQGELDVKGWISQEKAALDIKSKGLQVQAVAVPAFKGHIEKNGNAWKIQDGTIGQTRITAQALQEPEGWLIQNFSTVSTDLCLRGTARFNQGICRIDTTGVWREQATLKGGLSWNVNTHEAAQVHLQFQRESLVAKLSCPSVQWKEGKLTASVVQVILEHPALQEAIVAPLSCSFSSGNFIFQGPILQGTYANDWITLKSSEVHALYEQGVLRFQTKLSLNGIPLKAKGYFLPLEDGRGSVQLMEGDQTLQVDFAKFSDLQRVEGSLFGIDCTLSRKGNLFEGHIKLKTSDPLFSLLKKTEWKPFENLEFTGNFQREGDAWSVEGNLEGNETIVWGTSLHHLQANLNYHPTRFEMRGLSIEDEAGELSIKECSGIRSHPLKAWEMTIPYVRGQHIQPALLRKAGDKPKPFQIRQLTLTQIKGILGRPLTFQGRGSLYFTQKEKRDPSLFDLPREFLKEWGLDLMLLSPSRGTADVELAQGKIFFKSLKETFSEGNHSEFFLSDQEPSYIDLNGNMCLNLRVKQNVLLKLAESFTLSVRGSWEKPRYILR